MWAAGSLDYAHDPTTDVSIKKMAPIVGTCRDQVISYRSYYLIPEDLAIDKADTAIAIWVVPGEVAKGAFVVGCDAGAVPVGELDEGVGLAEAREALGSGLFWRR